MPEDNPLLTLTESLLREAAHRQRYAQEDKAALLQEVLQRAQGPQAHLQTWWRQRTGEGALATVAFLPEPGPALAAPRVRGTREVVGQHLRAQLSTTESGETLLHVEAEGTHWASTLLLLSWQPYETSALQQALVLLGPPSPQGWCYGSLCLGRLTEAAEIVLAEQQIDDVLLQQIPLSTVQDSINRAVDRRGWRLWYHGQQDQLAPTLRQAVAAALEDS